MAIALKTPTALPVCSVRVCHKTHLAYEEETMAVALTTSTALPACSVCACHGDTPGLRGRDDVDRAQDLDGAARSSACACHRTHLV
jgi:hypothetical protein